jgi:hypothetical protein
MKITDLYANDLAVEIKNYYIEKLQLGYDNQESLRLTLEQYEGCFYSKDEDMTDYWLVMADTQWVLGRLDDSVKNKAIDIIENDEDLIHYAYDQCLYDGRKEVLRNLLERLKSPQPEPKKIKKLELYICPWKVNDAYALQMKGKDAANAGIENRWLIIIKIDEKYIKPGHIMPIVRFKLTKSDRLPETLSDINELPYFMLYNVKGLIIYKSFIWIEKKKAMSKVLKRLIYLGNFDFVEPYEPPTSSQSLVPIDLIEQEIPKRYSWYYNVDSI